MSFGEKRASNPKSRRGWAISIQTLQNFNRIIPETINPIKSKFEKQAETNYYYIICYYKSNMATNRHLEKSI